MHPLIAFYRGEGTDHRGRTFNGILAFSNTEMESCHDYIQWLFPLRDPSPYNPEAPVVTEAVAAAFRASPELQKKVHQALLRMMHFYSMVLKETPQGFELLLPAEPSALHWLTVENHNHRRISRILASLKLLGLDAHVSALWLGLQKLAVQNPQAISSATITHWRLAAMGMDTPM
ncbi:opioid growth factor receptor-related protein [Thalassolituus sp. LLYu03]|uniref:opioid growth factor receptor-related protein n=1 Tax=Thalassolituus sp. LLYu03 TaxID=3421656 RepID=UPI003D2D97E8